MDKTLKDPLANVREIRLALVKRHTRNLSSTRVNSWCACVKFGERYCSPQPIFKNSVVYRIRRSFLTKKDETTGKNIIWYKNETWRTVCWERVNQDRLKAFKIRLGNPEPEPIPIYKEREKKGTKLQDLSPEQKRARNNLQTQLGVYRRRLEDYNNRPGPHSTQLQEAILRCGNRISILKSQIDDTLNTPVEGVMSEVQKQLLAELT